MQPITDPQTLNFLEGSTQPSAKPIDDPSEIAQLEYGIDVNGPRDQVRAAIAQLPAAQRPAALRNWADAVVKKERAEGGIGQTVDDVGRTLARGTFVGPFLDEVTAASQKVLQTLSGGAFGSDYDEALEYQRAQDRAVDSEAPVLSTVGKVVGGLVGGIGAVKALEAPDLVAKATAVAAGGPFAATQLSGSLPRQMAQGSAMGAGYGAAAGFGAGEGEGRVQSAVEGAQLGAGGGAILPAAIAGGAKAAEVISDVAGPSIARIGTNLQQAGHKLGLTTPEQPPRSLSAAAVPNPVAAPAASGAEAAAEQMIANQLTRSGVTVPQLRERLQDANDAARFHSRSNATNALAPVDLDPSLQRLMSSATRQQPEAGNLAQSFMFSRQTGLNPPNGVAALPENAGLKTRAPLSKPDPAAPPMGQFERVRDALKRALLIRDEDWHEVGRNAYEAEKILVKKAKDAAQPYYKSAYKAAADHDIRPTLQPIIDKWIARMAEEPAGAAAAIRRTLNQFAPKGMAQNRLHRFDKAKQFVDQDIKKYFLEGQPSVNKYVGGLVVELKNELLAAVDSIADKNIGKLYSTARKEFSSPMELVNSLNLGRSVFREDSDIAVDAFRDLVTPVEQKMFRFGLLEGFENQMSRQKRSADITQTFESPRVQEILEAVIPRAGDDAVFANRPERFGKFISNEKRMIGTRDEIAGNSKTAQRLQDDKSYNQLESVNKMFAEFAQQPSGANMVVRSMQYALDTLFGIRADTAMQIAQKLLVSDPTQRAVILARIAERMGPSRAEMFAQLMAEHQRRMIQAGANAGATNQDR